MNKTRVSEDSESVSANVKDILQMDISNLTQAEANLDLVLWDAEADSIDSSDLYIWLRESGLPSEVAIRLKNLIGVTKKVADQVINIGKIILIKIIEFVKDHPNLATGIAIGAAIGVVINMVPFLGPFLSPIAMALGIIVGASVGYRMDKADKENEVEANLNFTVANVTQDIIEIAREFFEAIIAIFNTIFGTSQLEVV